MFGLPAAARPYITAVTTQFNAALPGLIVNLESMAGFDADITLIDAFSVGQSMFTNPAAYGFTNVTDPAFPATSAMRSTISSGIPSTPRLPPTEALRTLRWQQFLNPESCRLWV